MGSRCPIAVGAMLLLAAGAGVAAAEPTRVSGSFGFGVLAGPASWEGPGAAVTPPPPPELHLEGRVVFGALSAKLFVGKDVSRVLAAGLVLDGTLLYSGDRDRDLGFTSFDAGAQVAAGGGLVWRPPGFEVFWRFGAGAALAYPFGTSRSDFDAVENVVSAEPLVGPVLDVALGWKWLSWELRAGALFGEHTLWLPVMFTVRAHLGPH